MKRKSKVVGIIIASLLTLVGLSKLLPAQSPLGILLHDITIRVENEPIWNIVLSLIIIILGSFILVAMAYDIKGEKKRHTFKVGSKSYCTFFSKWYSHAGTLSIFCDDLEGWINPNGNNIIYDKLKIKSSAKELHLFLGRESPVEVINELRRLGATVDRAPIDIVTNYSFSCLAVMGNHSAVIVRNKQLDKSTSIVFEEITDSYISGLLNALIKEGVSNE